MTEKITFDFNEETIIAISDVHLGFLKSTGSPYFCDKAGFDSFLSKLQRNPLNTDDIKCDRLIICGDLLDMWRRDPAGVVYVNSDTLELIKDVNNRLRLDENDVRIHYIVGNHDFHLIHLDNYDYPFSFHRELNLIGRKSNGDSYNMRFLHGDIYDFMVKFGIDKKHMEQIYESLCQCSDEMGDFYDNTWRLIRSCMNWVDRIKNIYKRLHKKLEKLFLPVEKGKVRKLKTAETRFDINVLKISAGNEIKLIPAKFPDIEKRVIESAGDNTVLVFGHTHKPFIHRNMSRNITVANTGSWIRQDKLKREDDNYIMIDKEKITLYAFKVNMKDLELSTVTI